MQLQDSGAGTPIFVALDRCLLSVDTLPEAVCGALATRPVPLLRLFWDWLVGRRNFREGLFAIYTPRVTTLPYNRELLNYLSGQSASGRKVYVAPGADPKITREVAKHLELPEVSPTPGDDKSPDGNNPVSLMASAAGSPQFCYAGSPTRSAEIWRRCGSAIVVGGSPQAPRKIADVCRVEQSFPANRSGLATYLRAMRAYQWVKNALLIVPLLPGLGQMTPHRFVLVGVGFAAFCLCSSSFYVINDLLDLASDRRHPSKRARPFAAGILSVQRGLLLAACLFVAGVSLAALVSPTFLAATALYLAGTAAYSLGGKRLVLIDVLILAGLYALRVAAGAIAAKLSLSFWMLAFSMALFLSLAFVKRYGELQSLAKRGEEWPPGRGYRAADMPLLEMFGIGTGLGAVLTLSLYLEQDAARASFRHPFVLAALCPVLLYWIFRVWLHAHRGMMHEDPVVFAITDRVSRFVLLIAAAIVAVAHL